MPSDNAAKRQRLDILPIFTGENGAALKNEGTR
jgi:hypothetical protein